VEGRAAALEAEVAQLRASRALSMEKEREKEREREGEQELAGADAALARWMLAAEQVRSATFAPQPACHVSETQGSNDLQTL
jgi:hypothetical protein